jgi:hypothetical protein
MEHRKCRRFFGSRSSRFLSHFQSHYIRSHQFKFILVWEFCHLTGSEIHVTARKIKILWLLWLLWLLSISWQIMRVNWLINFVDQERQYSPRISLEMWDENCCRKRNKIILLLTFRRQMHIWMNLKLTGFNSFSESSNRNLMINCLNWELRCLLVKFCEILRWIENVLQRTGTVCQLTKVIKRISNAKRAAD